MLRRSAGGRIDGKVTAARATATDYDDDDDAPPPEDGAEIEDSVKRRTLRFQEWKDKKDREKNDPKVKK